MLQVLITAPERAELVEMPSDDAPLEAHEVRGRTLVSLVSPGSELNWGFQGSEFPAEPGYAAVFAVEETGSEVADLSPGQLVFSSGRHAEYQRDARDSVCPLPEGLDPKSAVFARLMGVSMSTLNTTQVNPPARVLVTGLGPVGLLAAQVFSRCGYRVTGVDPVKSRRELATSVGITDVRATINDSDAESEVDLMSLHLECSGHEQAVLAGSDLIAPRGEVVLIGKPWHRRTDLPAHRLLLAIYSRYLVMRSGWEWEVPIHRREFSHNWLIDNYEAALSWLTDGSVEITGLATVMSPDAAQEAYSTLLEGSFPSPTALFDWQQLSND